MIPVLKDSAVKLRGFKWADFSAFADMWQEPEVAKYIPFAPIAPRQNWARFNANVYAWVKNGFGNWAVVDSQDTLLGTIGFFRGKGGFGAGYDDAIQAGWVFSAHAHGRGIATQAAGLAHGWFDQQPFAARSVCGMDPDHIASIRVAEKTGYRFFRENQDQWGRVQLMERIKP